MTWSPRSSPRKPRSSPGLRLSSSCILAWLRALLSATAAATLAGSAKAGAAPSAKATAAVMDKKMRMSCLPGFREVSARPWPALAGSFACLPGSLGRLRGPFRRHRLDQLQRFVGAQRRAFLPQADIAQVLARENDRAFGLEQFRIAGAAARRPEVRPDRADTLRPGDQAPAHRDALAQQ